MKAIRFQATIPRYLSTKTLGRFFPSVFYGPMSCITYDDVKEPSLPNQEWVKVRVKFCGICGSDLNLIFLHDSPATSPFASFPFTIGHEIVGVIEELGREVKNLSVGERVVIDPILSCEARGFHEPCPACHRGDFSLCERMTIGDVSPGLLIGACRDTGGGWSPRLVAHQSQILKVPQDVSDLNAVMTDPFATALHGVMRDQPRDNETVLVIGAGVIGICVVAAIRSLGSKARVIVLVKHPFQAEMARRYGADEVVLLSSQSDYNQQLADLLGARVLKPIFGSPVIQGGADIVYECVGKDQSINDSLRFAKSKGKVNLLGVASIPHKVDWTPIWLNELDIKGSFACGTEEYQGERLRTYALALNLMRSGKVDLASLVTHRFPLDQYREAIETAAGKGRTGAIKVIFEP
ncbi:alcohol dehydrogenase catalytic domain-containing protein [Brevibacillus halotolerans]|uniref:alcohol dehydrogenase catalytic domain-containing protein n=1 Tax=Brevibacillus halotolerans TaxID=1507437 RepID=UPI0015EF34B3|nr:alcohol dehydrogenase catalytic domain-containing protein [Brevibacillus halotolerans]